MQLKPEDAALFTDDPFADPFGDPKPAPAPVPAKPSLVMPSCADCGTDLNPDNGSQLRDGTWKHIGCPKGAAPAFVGIVPPDAPTNDPNATLPEKAKRARRTKAEMEAARAAETAKVPKAPVDDGYQEALKALQSAGEAVLGAAVSTTSTDWPFAKILPDTATLRDQFAASALMGLAFRLGSNTANFDIGKEAYAMADLALKARDAK